MKGTFIMLFQDDLNFFCVSKVIPVWSTYTFLLIKLKKDWTADWHFAYRSFHTCNHCFQVASLFKHFFQVLSFFYYFCLSCFAPTRFAPAVTVLFVIPLSCFFSSFISSLALSTLVLLILDDECTKSVSCKNCALPPFTVIFFLILLRAVRFHSARDRFQHRPNIFLVSICTVASC